MDNTIKKTEGAVANTETKTATGKLKIQSPWIITYKKIVALFGRDADLEISSIVGLPDGNYGLSIFSKNTPKLQAIEKILKSEYTFGNVKLYISFIFEENNKDSITAVDFKTAFSGNSILSNVYEREDITRTTINTYVLFSKEVIQFFNDNLKDFYGNYNGLAEDIAREIFNESDVSYGTDID